MKMRIFSVHDSKSEVYGHPILKGNSKEMVRMFGDAVNNEQSPFYHHPADYTLFEIGSFDDNTGQIQAAAVFVNHGNALTYKNVLVNDVPKNPSKLELVI